MKDMRSLVSGILVFVGFIVLGGWAAWHVLFS